MTTFTGTTGNDTLVGTMSADDMYGLIGNDSISGGAGDDTIIGGGEFAPVGGGLLEALTDDVIVHASSTGTQNGSQAAPLTGGGYVVTWRDDNLGTRLARVMDDNGNPVGSAIPLANGGYYGAVTGLSNGDFAVATVGTIGMSSGVVIEIFDAGGSPVGSPFLANTTTPLTATVPTMTSLSGGGFVVTWPHDLGGGDYDVLAQIFDNSGSAVGSEFTVNDTTAFIQTLPQVVTLSGGNFVVTWQGTGPGDTAGVFGKIYDSSGSVVASEFALHTTTTGAQEYLQLVALDGGDFLALWQTDSGTVRGQIFDPTGTAVGSEIDLGTVISTRQGGPYMFAASLPGGGFILTYMDGYADPDMYAQMFDATGTKVGVEIQVNRDDLDTQSPEDLIRLANDNLVFSGYTVAPGTGEDVFNRVFSFDGSGGTTPPSDDDYLDGGTGNDSISGGGGDDTIIGGGEFSPIGGGMLEALTGDVIVHASTTATQNGSQAAALTGGGYVITWDDQNLGTRLARVMDDNGNPVGSAIPLANGGYYGAVTGLSNGDFAVATVGTIGMSSGVVIEIFDAGGSPVGSPFLANTTTPLTATAPTMTSLSGGGFVVTWPHDLGGGDYDVLAQIFDNSGSAVGSEFTVNDTTSFIQTLPQVVTLSGGNFVVTWQGTGPGDTAGVFGKIYDSSGSVVASEFALHTTTTGAQEYLQLVALDGGDFLALWQTDSGTVRGQIFDPTGAAIGGEIDFGNIASTWQWGPYTFVAALPGGGFILTYMDGYADPDIYAQRFDETGTKVGVEIQVNRGDFDIQSPEDLIRLANDNLVFSGYTVAPGTGEDVFNRVFSFDDSGGTTPPSDNDHLNGGAGDDSISGGAGDDTIIGAQGVDSLRGGQGADTFIYSSASASGVGSSNRDVISDFDQSQGDTIDLSGFGGTLTFVGTSSFSSSPNEVRYSVDIPNNRTLIEVDVNGDGSADMDVELTGQLSLVAGDILSLAVLGAVLRRFGPIGQAPRASPRTSAAIRLTSLATPSCLRSGRWDSSPFGPCPGCSGSVTAPHCRRRCRWEFHPAYASLPS